MPWFPDFVSAGELARRQTRDAGHADPVGQYLTALNDADTHALETVWPGEVVVHDPHAGEIRGHRHLRRFVKDSQAALAEHHARTETVASTVSGRRAVVELLAHVTLDGELEGERERVWPVTVVAESPDDRSVIFCSYFSRALFEGHRYVRPPVLGPGSAHPGDVVGRYQAALEAGDVEAIVSTFDVDGYYRESIGPPFTHRGATELRSFFTACFGAGGGIGLQHCRVTDDGVRCALEYNCVRWGSYELPPQAGIAIFERSADGLLAAARIYDDVEPPVSSSGSS
jgi:hypothetical protein